MKRSGQLFFLLIIIFFNQNIFSQSKIEGISVFKIDKTNVKIIDSLVNSGYKLTKCNNLFNCSKYETNKMTIYELVNDTIKTKIELPFIKENQKIIVNEFNENDNSQKIGLPLFKENRKFIISEYNVAGIKITNLELNFYNDVLFEIFSKGDLELQIALKEKYDEKINIDKKVISCHSIYGEFKKEEIRYTTTFRDDEKIQAYSVLSNYFDDKCKEKTINFTLITNQKTQQLVFNKNAEISKKIDEKKQQQKKTQLNKL